MGGQANAERPHRDRRESSANKRASHRRPCREPATGKLTRRSGLQPDRTASLHIVGIRQRNTTRYAC
jgi:hypothetical protein